MHSVVCLSDGTDKPKIKPSVLVCHVQEKDGPLTASQGKVKIGEKKI